MDMVALLFFFCCCQNCDVFFSLDPETLHKQLEDLLPLMIEALPSCHFSAKRHRLDCLYFLVVYVSKVILPDYPYQFKLHWSNACFSQSRFLISLAPIPENFSFFYQVNNELRRHEIISSFLTEIILALKEVVFIFSLPGTCYFS